MQFHANIGQKAFVFNRNNEVLIVRQSDYLKQGTNKWDVPGGRVQEGEDLKEAIIRELQEETGIRNFSGPLLVGYHTFKTETNENWLVLHHAFRSDDEVKLSKEHTEFMWISSDSKELEKMEFKHKSTQNFISNAFKTIKGR